jgi:hypothetical protein
MGVRLVPMRRAKCSSTKRSPGFNSPSEIMRRTKPKTCSPSGLRSILGREAMLALSLII